MEKIDTGFVILLVYYGVCLFGCMVPKPRLVLYVLVACGLIACWVLFQLKIYVEMGGLLHTLPWAFVASWISKHMHAKKRKPKD